MLLLLLLILVARDDDDTKKKRKPSSRSFCFIPSSQFFVTAAGGREKKFFLSLFSFSQTKQTPPPPLPSSPALYSTHLNTHADYLLLYPERMSALSLSTPIVTNARVSSTRRTRVSGIKASCSKSPSSSKSSSITLQGAPLKGLKMATQRNQYSVLMQTPPSRGKLQV